MLFVRFFFFFFFFGGGGRFKNVVNQNLSVFYNQMMKEKRPINIHVQMQIAVNVSTDLVNLVVWHNQKFERSNLTRFCKLGDCNTWNCHSNKLNQLIQMPLNTWKEAHFINTHVQWHLQRTTENFSLGLSKQFVWTKCSVCKVELNPLYISILLHTSCVLHLWMFCLLYSTMKGCICSNHNKVLFCSIFWKSSVLSN